MFAWLTKGKARVAGLLLVALLGGCGRQATLGTVSGRVTLVGRPLTAGLVSLHGADGSTAFAMIQADGTFRVDQVNLGPARVTITPRTPPGLANVAAPRQSRPGRVAAIPSRYHRPESSGLVCAVRAGPQTFNIELRP
jgi:hypothetical protein